MMTAHVLIQYSVGSDHVNCDTEACYLAGSCCLGNHDYSVVLDMFNKAPKLPHSPHSVLFVVFTVKYNPASTTDHTNHTNYCFEKIIISIISIMTNISWLACC